MGERVATLTVYGGYAEYVYVAEKKLISVPAVLDPTEVVLEVVGGQEHGKAARFERGDE